MMLAVQVDAGEEAVRVVGAAFFVSCCRSVMKKSYELLCDLMAWNGGAVVKWADGSRLGLWSPPEVEDNWPCRRRRR